MTIISSLVGVFGVAFIYFIGAIPAGLALRLNPVVVAATVWLSYVVGVAIVILIGEPIRARLMARFAPKGTDKGPSQIQRVWDRFGLAGLSLLAPLTVGGQIGAALGLSLGVKPRNLLLGMALGAAAWAAAITLVATLGVNLLRH